MRVYFLTLIVLLSVSASFAQDNSAEIIRYANNVIALTNQYYQKVNVYQKKVAQLEKDRDKAEIDKETPIHFECADGKTQTTRLFREATNPPAAFSPEDQKFFKAKVEKYRNSLNQLDDFCYAISDDINGCDFKQDEFVKFDSLLRDTNFKIDDLLQLHQSIVKQIMNQSTDAEKVIDKQSPLGPLVTPMKMDLRLSKSILDKVLNYTPETITGVKIEVLRLRGGIAKSDAMKVLHKNEYDKKYTKQFDRFYKSLEYDFADTAKEIADELEKAGEKGNYKKFTDHQQRLLEEYNQLVKLYNTIGLAK